MYIKDDIEFKYTKKNQTNKQCRRKKKNNNNNTKLHKRKINYCKKTRHLKISRQSSRQNKQKCMVGGG